MISILDLITLFDECQQIEIYDWKKGRNVYKGEMRNIPQEFLNCEILSFDEIKENTITINI